MQLKATLIFLLCSFGLFGQSDDIQKHIVRTFDNGNPYVIIYTKGPLNERVKEEIYYESGQLDYEGHYKNGKEHGTWTYYWPNGQMKSIEYYEKGLEQGTMYDYDDQGRVIKEYQYMRGKLVREETFEY